MNFLWEARESGSEALCQYISKYCIDEGLKRIDHIKDLCMPTAKKKRKKIKNVFISPESLGCNSLPLLSWAFLLPTGSWIHLNTACVQINTNQQQSHVRLRSSSMFQSSSCCPPGQGYMFMYLEPLSMSTFDIISQIRPGALSADPPSLQRDLVSLSGEGRPILNHITKRTKRMSVYEQT